MSTDELTELLKLESRSLEELAQLEKKLKARMETADATWRNVRAAIVRRMTELGQDQTTTTGGWQITVVRGQSKSFDPVVVKDVLVPRGLWERARVVTESVDHDAVMGMLDRGEVSEEELAPALRVKEIKPYPKVTQPRRTR